MQHSCPDHGHRSLWPLNCLVSLVLLCSIIPPGLPGPAAANSDNTPPATSLAIKDGYSGRVYSYVETLQPGGLRAITQAQQDYNGQDVAISITSPAADQTFWPGQEITVSGMASGLAAATVIVDDPDGNGVFMANDLDAGSGSYGTVFRLGNNPAGGIYTVWAGLVGTDVSCKSSFQVANPARWFSLASPATGQTYDPGGTVTIAGAVYNLPSVTITATDPTGASIFTSGSLDTSGGSLATSFTLGSAAITGRYTIAIKAPSLITPYTIKIGVGQDIAGGPNTGLPDQIILSWTDDPLTTQTISWRTGSDTTQDEVEYLPAAVFDGSFSGARQATASRNDLYPGSYHFAATIRGLSPGAGYIYRVGRDGAWSRAASFTTAAPSGGFSFLYMGDVQEGYQEWGDLLQAAAREKPGTKFALLGGDLVDDSTGDQWQQFFAAATPLFRQIPLLPAAGNHDDGTLFWNSFAVPRDSPDGFKEFYSFDYGNCHIAVLDSNYMGAPGTDEYNIISAWLRSDLTSSVKTWKFVVLHYPPYEVYPDGHAANLRANWAPIFEQCGVDVVFDGHQHVYARTRPMKDGRIQTDGSGIVYIMGNAGTKYLPAGPYYSYVARELACVSSYAVVSIDGNDLNITARDANGQVIDSYGIMKWSNTSAQYTITPVDSTAYQAGMTADGIATMTVSAGVSGLIYFSVQAAPLSSHEGLESVVFTHLRGGVQDGLNVTRADFDTVQSAQAGFNVQPGDVVKAYIVDDLTGATDVSPIVLQ